MIGAATLQPSPYESIIVHSRSRFSRDLFQFLQYERLLKKSSVRVISITQITTDDASGEMSSKMFSLFDEYQSKENSKHTRRAMQENARQGYWNGSQPPYGYRTVETETIGNRGRRKRRIEVDPAEAEIVKSIYELYLHGHQGEPLGMKAIATHLNARSVTMRGRPWRVQKVNEVLSSPVYGGCFYFNRRDSKTLRIRPQNEWIAVDVPVIVSADLIERAAARRASSNPKMHPPRAVSSRAPLVGLLRCGHCGAGMAQASGKSGHYRYYKCTTRLNKGINRCDSRNLPREKADAVVLEALANRVFTPQRVELMVRELVKRQRAARTVEDTQALALKKSLDHATAGLQRLYDVVERGILLSDDTLRARAQKLQARRNEVLIELAKIQDRKSLGIAKISPNKIKLFCDVLKARLTDPQTDMGKAYLRLLVSEIKLQGDQLTLRGSHEQLAHALGFVEKMKLGEVPSFIPDWRARQDSNPRPPLVRRHISLFIASD